MEKTPRRWRRLAIVCVVVLAVLGALGGYRSLSEGEGDVDFRAVEVVQGDLERTVTALGSLRPKEYVDVGTQVSGQLRAVHVAIGDRVEAGDLLAEIDPTVYEIRLRTTQANLAQLQAQRRQQEAEYQLAQARLARNERLLAQSAVSRETVDESRAAAAVAAARIAAIDAQIDAAQSTLAGDRANLGYTRIYAPMAGTVVDESAVTGQTVNASQSAPTIVRLANLDTMTVWAQVAEADVTRLRPGMPAYFTTLGLPERRWEAEIRQILPTPEIVNDVVLYNVLLDVDNRSRKLMPEMTVHVFFLLDAARDVPVLPAAALQRDSEGGERVRVVGADGRSQWRRVEVGLRTRTHVEITAGLEVGDRVLLGGDAGSRGAVGFGARGRL